MTEPDTSQFAKPKPVNDNRITVAEMFYFQQPDREAMQVENRTSRILKMREQPWIRETEATEEFQSLEFGWIEKPGTIIIKTYPLNLPVNPTEEQKQNHANGILFLSMLGDDAPFDKAGFLIHPGDQFRFSTTSPEQVRLKSMKGNVRFTIYAFTE